MPAYRQSCRKSIQCGEHGDNEATFHMSTSLIADGSLSTLADVAFANKYRLRRMWLISPWISASYNKADPVCRLIEAYRERHCTIRLLTRPPRDCWHLDAIRTLRERTSCEVMYSAQLHAKLYILECDGFRYGMLGSANLTRKADYKNRELAVEFRTTCTNRSDPVAAMIDELLVFAYELMSDEAAQLQP
jgi:phosphatidylserine/phosphatidylglycerophosphate/cardiolipin synthase-like enzyme